MACICACVFPPVICEVDSSYVAISRDLSLILQLRIAKPLSADGIKTQGMKPRPFYAFSRGLIKKLIFTIFPHILTVRKYGILFFPNPAGVENSHWLQH